MNLNEIKTSFTNLVGRLKGEKNDTLSQSSSRSQTTTKHKMNFSFGNRISFYVDDDHISMSSVLNLGFYRKVLKTELVPIPTTYASNDMQAHFVSNTIEKFIAEHGTYFSIISTIISGKETTFRNFLMPNLKRRELDSAIQFEVKNRIPFPEDNCVFDYTVSGVTNRDEKKEKNISLFASTKRKVLQLISPFEKISKTVDNVYHLQEVTGYLLGDLRNFDSSKSYILLKVSEQNSEISFFKNQQLEFFHIITHEMGGIEHDQRFISEKANHISTGIRTALDFYAGQFQEDLNSEILVYGSQSYLRDLISALNENSNIEFNIFPVEQLNIQSELEPDQILANLPSIAASSCCARLRNLLPKEQKVLKKESRNKQLGFLSMAGISLVLFLGWSFLNSQIEYNSKELNEITTQIELFKNSEAFHKYNNLKNQIIAHRSYIDESKSKKGLFAPNLKELSKLTPATIKMLHLDLRNYSEKRNMSMQGIVVSSDIPPEIILAEYVESLSSSPLYSDVKLVRSVKKEIKNGFEIEFVLDFRGKV